jgi:hypothetical protein
LCERRFAQRSINTLPFPCNARHLVIFDQPRSPELLEEARGLPTQKMAVNGAGTAELFFGQGLPLNARSQDIDDAAKDLSGR